MKKQFLRKRSMGYDDNDLRRGIHAAVEAALNKGSTTTTELVDSLFVYMKKLIIQESRAYTVAELREMINGLS